MWLQLDRGQDRTHARTSSLICPELGTGHWLGALLGLFVGTPIHDLAMGPRLPQSMLPGLQAQLSKEQEVEVASFLQLGPENWQNTPCPEILQKNCHRAEFKGNSH